MKSSYPLKNLNQANVLAHIQSIPSNFYTYSLIDLNGDFNFPLNSRVPLIDEADAKEALRRYAGQKCLRSKKAVDELDILNMESSNTFIVNSLRYFWITIYN